MLTVLLVLLPLALFSMHIFGPILVRAKTKVAANPGFEILSDAQAEGLTSQIFLSMLYQIEVLGFSLVGHLSSAPDNIPGTQMILTLLVNRESKTMAVVMQVASLAPGMAHLAMCVLEFYSEFEDGSDMSTVNGPSAQVFYDSPKKLTLRIPHMKDAAGLYHIHSLYVAKQHKMPVLPKPGDELDHLVESVRKALAQQAELGYYFLDEKAGQYRLTWRGAFRTTWRMLWPLKQIIEQRQQQKGRRIAAEALAG